MRAGEDGDDERVSTESVVSVDASEAGAGNLEVVVRSTKTGARIPHFLEADDRSTGLFQIRFSPPPDCFRFQIDVSFNDLSINGERVQVLKGMLPGDSLVDWEHSLIHVRQPQIFGTIW